MLRISIWTFARTAQETNRRGAVEETYVLGEERGDERGDVWRDGSEDSVAPRDRWVRQGDGFRGAKRPLGEARRRFRSAKRPLDEARRRIPWRQETAG